jgi:hypothetical protein
VSQAFPHVLGDRSLESVRRPLLVTHHRSQQRASTPASLHSSSFSGTASARGVGRQRPNSEAVQSTPILELLVNIWEGIVKQVSLLICSSPEYTDSYGHSVRVDRIGRFEAIGEYRLAWTAF